MDLIVHLFISSFRYSIGLMMTFGSFGVLHCRTKSAHAVICTLVSVCLLVIVTYILPALLVVWLIYPV